MSNLTKEALALTQKLYEEKCAHPSAEDILNCLYDMREDQDKQDDLVSSIQQLWNQNDEEFGAMTRAKFKQSFLEVAEIEALEELGIYWESCQKALESNEGGQ